MSDRFRRLLSDVVALYPCIIVSGRSTEDVRKRLRGVSVQEVIGNHGIEPWQATEHFDSEVRRWKPLLERSLATHRGIQIEDKRFSIAVHYRKSREKKKARALVLRAAGSLGDVRVIGGKLVINLLPKGAPHKGSAVEAARERLRCDTAIYVGDDETDEDVFALEEPGRLLAVRVGAKRASLASYCVRGQPQVGELMRVLIDLRRKSGRRSQAVG
jgi:trehalose 6-phosphate phosphatase